MDLESTRRVGLGVAGAVTEPARAIAGVGLRTASAGYHTPLGSPLRALLAAAERRGTRDELRLRDTWTAWFERAARSPLLDRAVRTLVEARVLERLATEALAGDALERVLAVAAQREVGPRVADTVLADDSVERLVAHVIEQPAVDRLVERVLASHFAHAATDQLLASDELRRVVAHVAASEEVREALHSQTAGLVDDVGDQLRERTTTVDDRLESVARRWLRRQPRSAPLASFDEGPATA